MRSWVPDTFFTFEIRSRIQVSATVPRPLTFGPEAVGARGRIRKGIDHARIQLLVVVVHDVIDRCGEKRRIPALQGPDIAGPPVFGLEHPRVIAPKVHGRRGPSFA